MRSVLLISLLALTAACDSGPSPEDIAKAEAEKNCGKLYSSQTKAWQDALYSRGVAEVNFVDKDKYVAKCIESDLTDAQRKCMDPNYSDSDDCKKELEPIKEKSTALRDLLLSPMKEKKEEPKEGEGEGEAKEGEGEEKSE